MAAKESKNLTLNWHPDFRNVAALPDVKVVRTGFLVNFIALIVPIGLLCYLAYNELGASDYRSRLEGLQKTIEAEAGNDNSNRKSSGTFTTESKKVDDLEKFYGEAEHPIDVLVALSESRPDYIAFKNYDCSWQSIKLGGKKTELVRRYRYQAILRGSDAGALAFIDDYIELLHEVPLFKDRIHSCDYTEPRRNVGLDLFEFEVTLVLRNEVQQPKKK